MTAAYVVLGWIILQVINNLSSAVALPAWSSSLLVVILLAGFPVVIIGAWAFELTPDGLKRTEAGCEQAPGKISKTDLGLMGLMVAVLVIAGAGLVRQPPAPVEQLVSEDITVAGEESETATTAPSRLAIAVLPFADMSPEGDQDWFSDGISEEIIHRLVQQKELIVAGRTSSFYFKNKNVPFEEIGRILNVGTVLEGSVRKFENRIRITAQLIDIKTGAHRWSGTYDRELEDIFKIQDELSVAIATELLREMGLAPSQVRSIYEPNLAAFEAYLRAIRVSMSGDFVGGIDWFRRSAALDKGYFSPRLGLLVMAGEYQGAGGIIPASHQIDIAALGTELLQLDLPPPDRLAFEAVIAGIDFRFADQERLFREAIGSTNVLASEGLLTFASLLKDTGRPEEALSFYRTVLRRDPLSLWARSSMASALLIAGRSQDVVDHVEASRSLGIDTVELGSTEVLALAALGREPDFDAFLASVAGPSLGQERYTQAFRMRKAEYEDDKAALEELRGELMSSWESGDQGTNIDFLAETLVLLGREDEAIAWFRLGFAEKRPIFRSILNAAPSWPPRIFLVEDPRGRKLLKDAGWDLAWFDGPEER